MKYAKILGLALVASLTFIAFTGASSASAATVICQTSESPCPEKYVEPAGASVGGALFGNGENSGSFSLAGGGMWESCRGVILGATSTKEWGSPLQADGVGLISDCPKFCPITMNENSEHIPSTLEAGSNFGGTLIMGNTKGHAYFTRKCGAGGGQVCTWGTAALHVEITPLGLQQQELIANEAPLTLESGPESCGNTAEVSFELEKVTWGFLSVI